MSLSLGNIDNLLLVAGISGGGKTTAINTLSDEGFYTVDNLPVPLFKQFIDHSSRSSAKFGKTALLLNIDSSDAVDKLNTLIKELKNAGEQVQLLFLDCSSSDVLKRYSETRRPHPLFDPAQDKTLEDAVDRERVLLTPIKNLANLVIDTSGKSVHDLRREIRGYLESLMLSPGKKLRVNFLSFGFKYGAPISCDLLVDVRFLKNPYFVDSLREKTGLDEDVRDYVLEQKDTQEFVKTYLNLLQFLLPRYADEGKAYINVGIGCTGGRHRSVAISEQLCQEIGKDHELVSTKHRDISK